MSCSGRIDPGVSRRLLEIIKDFGTLAIVGAGRATGKTEVMKAFVKAACLENLNLAVTSLGTEGDATEKTSEGGSGKIKICRNMLFATLEKFFLSKELVAEIVYLSDFWTPVGRIAVGRALVDGQLVLSGPATSSQVREIKRAFLEAGAQKVLIDGFASRNVHAAPGLSEGVILATGASLASDPVELVDETLHLVRMIRLPQAESAEKELLKGLGRGVWCIDSSGMVKRENSMTALNLSADFIEDDIRVVYTTGAVGERLVKSLLDRRFTNGLSIVVQDFTRLFVSGQILDTFVQRGGRIRVMERAELAAITVNPVLENNRMFESSVILESLSSLTGVPVVDVFSES